MPTRDNLITLLTWLSPAFPVGAFSYSHGLEAAIVDLTVSDAESLRDWIGDLLTVGSGWNDAVLFAAAWRAAASGSDELAAVAELAEALAASAERHLETMQQGEAFLTAVRAAWPSPVLDRLVDLVGGRAAYPVAVGMAAASRGLPLDASLAAYLQAFASSLVSVAVRLVPLGQTRGLLVLADLAQTIEQTAGRAEEATIGELGSATLLADIAAMRHETQYSRIFRT